MWTCPSCGAPQAETARCWVCRRSSTTCSTCAHFRRAVSGTLGYCGLDPRRHPLTGLEQRGCWEARPEAPETAAPAIRAAAPPPVPATVPDAVERLRPRPAARGFVPVDPLGSDPWVAVALPKREPVPDDAPSAEEPAAADAPPPFIIEPDERWSERTSLFGEPEG